MDKKDILWNRFAVSGSVDDYLKYCMTKGGEEKADELKHRRLDNKGEERGGAEQNGNGSYA